MLFIIVPLIVTIAIIWWACTDWSVDLGDVILGILLNLLVTPLILLGIWLGIEGFYEPNQEIISTETVEIQALADNMKYSSTLTGNIFLIQSTSESELKYYYMYKDPDKGFAFNDAPANSCYLNTTTDTPCVKILKYDYTNWFMKWAFPRPGVVEYVFYLPEEAEIIDDFTVDFQ